MFGQLTALQTLNVGNKIQGCTKRKGFGATCHMHNVLRVWKRDIIRLFKAPAALVVVGALIVLPSLYTWFNVIGFWNPYENTGNLRVCVVNEDAGAESDLMGKLDIGSQIVESLKGNDQLGWAFVDRETAESEVMSGSAYAMFVIPEDFSRCFTTLLDEGSKRPTLEYRVNEKNGAVAPKITDTGATTLDETINETFTSAASEAVAESVDAALSEYRSNVSASNSDALGKLGDSIAEIDNARTAMKDLSSHVSTARDRAKAAQSELSAAKDGIALAAQSLDDASSLTFDLQKILSEFWASMQSTLDEGSSFASQSAAKARQFHHESPGLGRRSACRRSGDAAARAPRHRGTRDAARHVAFERPGLRDPFRTACEPQDADERPFGFPRQPSHRRQ